MDLIAQLVHYVPLQVNAQLVIAVDINITLIMYLVVLLTMHTILTICLITQLVTSSLIKHLMMHSTIANIIHGEIASLM